VHESLMRLRNVHGQPGNEVENVQVQGSLAVRAVGIDVHHGASAVIGDTRHHDGSSEHVSGNSGKRDLIVRRDGFPDVQLKPECSQERMSSMRSRLSRSLLRRKRKTSISKSSRSMPLSQVGTGCQTRLRSHRQTIRQKIAAAALTRDLTLPMHRSFTTNGVIQCIIITGVREEKVKG